ncbi:MAG: [FeFe] hydrogenase H-cluster maturation GTPase HydF [Megasphaera micronuciformis]|nr:[FeFe] hydrogenase H-cluster maturation GTPase HydF [Megasphaera micronuciformis]
MGMNETPRGERIHIGFFGNRNAGKSSLVNAVTGQYTAIVSDVKGTTTDPVYKAMELLPLGPVVLIDTPGLDDAGKVGLLRIEKTKEVLRKTDIAVIVTDGVLPLTQSDKELIALVKERKIPYCIVRNKADLLTGDKDATGCEIFVSAVAKTGIDKLKERLISLAGVRDVETPIISDLLHAGDAVVLVVPIDKAAPKGRLILPQQQTIREILEARAIAVVTDEKRLGETLALLNKEPVFIITDSQVFKEVAAIVPKHLKLTSFSVRMARHKGILPALTTGINAVKRLADGDTVLIAEGCTHHRQCEDIGTVKIPRWLKTFTKKDIHIETSSGMTFPQDLSPYSLVIHCGGCMLNEKEMKYRVKEAKRQLRPIVNYGILIAYMNGILERSAEAVPELAFLKENS